MERRFYTSTDLPRLARKVAASAIPRAKAKAKASPNREIAQRALARMRFAIAASAPSPKCLTLPIRGEIGGSVTAKWVKEQIAAHPNATEIALIVDSPGGKIVDAWEIYASLRAFPGRVTARVVGDCASAATEILLAADEREAVASAKFQLHRSSHAPLKPTTEAERLTAPRLRKIAAGLVAEDDRVAALYARRLGRPLATIKTMMERAQPFSAAEALKLNLVHAITNG